MTDSSKEFTAACDASIKEIGDVCDSHLKICLSRIQNQGLIGVNRVIELDGKKYLASFKPLVEEKNTPLSDAITAMAKEQGLPVIDIKPSEVVVPVGEKQAGVSDSQMVASSNGSVAPGSGDALGESVAVPSTEVAPAIVPPRVAEADSII